MVRENYIDLVSPSRLKKKEETTPAGPDTGSELTPESEVELHEDVVFTHLHNHSKFSVLRSTSGVKELVAKAKELDMPAVEKPKDRWISATFKCMCPTLVWAGAW